MPSSNVDGPGTPCYTSTVFEETQPAATRETRDEVFPGVGGETAPEPAQALPVEGPSPHPQEEPPSTAWRSYFGWFALLWMLDLAFLLYGARNGLPRDPELAKEVVFSYLSKAGVGLLVAGVLTFTVPLALVDESSHQRRTWWVAWLWPLVLVGMLLADLLIAGAALLPAVKVLKPD